MLGPSGIKESKKALDYLNLNEKSINIIDIGCGTGSQTLFLAKELNTEIIAIDFLQPFLDELNKKAENSGLKAKTICSTMDNLPFSEKTFDIIWSECAIYNIGFYNGIKYWKKFIKQNGYLAVSEATWLKNDRPNEIEEYWRNEYSKMDTIDNNIKHLINSGYKIIEHFTLPNYCWENYYIEIKNNIKPFLERYRNREDAKEFIEEINFEIRMYEKYKEYYGYEFYIVQNKIHPNFV
jgi:ubiquinone/menaquinone biosynthesis C-methylase UbiE